MTETEDYDKSATPTGHKASHQDEGSDEISVAGLAGELTAAQKSTWAKVSGKPASFTPAAHKASHENGGADEISVAGLAGELTAEQKSSWAKVSGKPASFTPAAHKSSHQNGGTDELDLTGLAGKIAEVKDDTTPQLGGELDAQAHSIGFTQGAATGDGTTTIDWKNGNKFKFTFGAQNDVLTFTAPSKPCSLLLVIVQDGTGSRTLTWPGTVKWIDGAAPTLSTGAGAVDIISIYYDGTNYYGQSAGPFS